MSSADSIRMENLSYTIGGRKILEDFDLDRKSTRLNSSHRL